MSRSRDVVDAVMFKRVTDGFIFRAPTLWPFAYSRYLLATETKKAEILQRVAGPGRWRLLVAIIVWLAVYAGAVAGLASVSGHDDPTVRDTVIMIVVAIVTLLMSLQAWYVFTLRPVVTGLPEKHGKDNLQ